MRNAVDVEIQSQTGVRTFIRLFPAITGIVAIVGIGTSLYFGRFLAVVPPSPIAVTGSTQTAIWEVNTPADFTYDADKIAFTSTRAELQPRPHWWDVNYRFRIPLTITTGNTPLTAGNTVVYRISTGFYTSFGALRADRRDLRIVYWDGTANQELNRDYVQHDDTRFAVQADLPANSSSTGEYYLYMGNAAAGAPPTDLNLVYEYSSDFSADVFSEPFPWQVYCGAQTAPFSSSGVLRHSVSTTSDCIAYKPLLMPATTDWYVESKIRINAGTQPVVGSLHLHDSADTLAAPNGDGYWMGIADNVSDSFFVRNKLNTFAPMPASATVTPGTTYRVTMKYDYVSPTSRLFSGWLDGVQVLNAVNDSNANFASGNAYAGIHVYQNGTTLADVEWDDFKVWRDLGATITIPGANFLEGQYFTDAPTLELKSGRGLRYGTLTNFSLVGANPNDVGFILSSDNGSTWQYLDLGTLAWLPSNGTFAQSSVAWLINALLPTTPFPQNGTLRWRAVLFSQFPGTTQSAVDQVAVGFTADPNDLDGDGYIGVARGGNDCSDSLTSLYSTVAAGCNPNAPPASVDLTLPIADHAWVQDDNGTYHLFFQDNVEPWSIQHYTTTNFTSFSLVGTALSRGTGASDFDRAGMWAPHVIRKDGTYYMFYTGVTGPGSSPTGEQRIGVATSQDLTTWTKVSVNNCSGTTGNGCVYTCEASWTAWSRGGQWDRQCRDPMVIFDPNGGVWKLLATTRLLSDANQVVTVATSSNLTTWTSEGYVEASHGGIAENPFVTHYNGNYYLFFTNYNSGYIKYAKSSTLAADNSGSTNWILQSSIGETGMNAPEVTVLNNDTWLFSESNYAGNPLGADLTLKRMVWNANGTFTLSNLTALACRVGSDTIHPEAAEVCGDGFDNSCSGQVDNPLICTACIDADGDGYGANSPSACPRAGQDCDDTKSTAYPGATEACDTVDNDCDGQTDEDAQCGLPLECVPLWSCSAWSACQNRQQTRTCTDARSCGSTTNRPALTQDCPATDQRACVEDWRCDAWSACAESRQSRTCTDRNACGTTSTKPTTTQTCGAGGQGAAKESFIAVVPNAGRPPQVRTFLPSGERLAEFLAYGEEFRKKSGAHVAVGDVDGDGKADIVTGTPVGWRPLLRLFDQSGQRLHQFHPYDSRSRVGVSVAVGDVDGDGVAEVLTAPAGRAGAMVNMYRYDAERPWFTGAGSVRVLAKHAGGLSLATADVDGDGQAEVLAAATGRSAPRVYIYDYDVQKKRFFLKRSFLAFSNGHRLGVSVAAGDVDGDGTPEIVASSGPGGSPHVRIFSPTGNLVGQFLAAGPKFREGAYPATLDVDGDGTAEILTVSNRRGAPNVFVFERTTAGSFVRLGSFPVFPVNYQTGLRIGTP